MPKQVLSCFVHLTGDHWVHKPQSGVWQNGAIPCHTLLSTYLFHEFPTRNSNNWITYHQNISCKICGTTSLYIYWVLPSNHLRQRTHSGCNWLAVLCGGPPVPFLKNTSPEYWAIRKMQGPSQFYPAPWSMILHIVWLVVSTFQPIWKIWVRQLRWLLPIYYGNIH